MKRLRGAEKPNLSFIMLISFLASFATTRTFTAFFPSVTLVVQGYHIHHFWYGLALLAIGGWIGINYHDEQTDRIAAMVFGTGGGLVGDQFGLLVTFGDYHSGLTYTFVISLFGFVALVTLFKRHGRAIVTEVYGSFRQNINLYIGLLLAFLSSAFLLQSDNPSVITLSGITFIIALALIIIRVTRYLRK